MLDNVVMKFTPAVRFYFLMQCSLGILLLSANYAAAQNKAVYRCPPVDKITHFTDNKAEADTKGCSLMTGGNVTVVQGTRVGGAEPMRVASVTPKTTTTSSNSPRNDSAEQKTRDSDSRGILESELKKAEAKQAELLKEYNNGEPDRGAFDIKMPQRYIERVAEMKASIARLSSDIEGIKRELGRNQGSTARAN
jgi:lipopolysaccharide export system protein LptA